MNRHTFSLRNTGGFGGRPLSSASLGYSFLCHKGTRFPPRHLKTASSKTRSPQKVSRKGRGTRATMCAAARGAEARAGPSSLYRGRSTAVRRPGGSGRADSGLPGRAAPTRPLASALHPGSPSARPVTPGRATVWPKLPSPRLLSSTQNSAALCSPAATSRRRLCEPKGKTDSLWVGQEGLGMQTRVSVPRHRAPRTVGSAQACVSRPRLHLRLPRSRFPSEPTERPALLSQPKQESCCHPTNVT